jgi:ABC-2 type transport system permease protein
MRKSAFSSKFFQISIIRLCHRQSLLAMLLAACLILPLCIAPAMESFFSRGVSFSGINLAITAREGDPVPALLEAFLPGMEDVSQYCQVQAMTQAEAAESLQNGDVTAVLVLPDGFIQGVLEGSNPDVELIVSADRPLEAMLTLWVGQSAADLLASVQSAIYGVLELYAQHPVSHLDYGQVVTQINLRFINWTLSRQDMFQIEHLSITHALPIGLHYGFSLLCFLVLSMAPFFFTLFERSWLRSQRRLQTAGIRISNCWGVSTAACWCLQFIVLFSGCCLIGKGDFWRCVGACGFISLMSTAFTIFCCNITGHLANCGLLSTLLGLLFMVLSGGILPPVMLPHILRSFMEYSPISWMRNLMGWTAHFPAPSGSSVLLLLLTSAALLSVSFLAYRKRFLQEVTAR